MYFFMLLSSGLDSRRLDKDGKGSRIMNEGTYPLDLGFLSFSFCSFLFYAIINQITMFWEKVLFHCND